MPSRRLAIAVVGLLLLSVPARAPAKPRTKVVNLTTGAFTIQPHRDREICRVMRVPGVPGMALESWEARSHTYRRGLVGTHHFTSYGYSGTNSAAFPGPNELVDDPGCSSLGPADFFKDRIFLAGSGGETIRGNWAITAGTMPGQLTQLLPTPQDTPNDAIVILNSHYFNESDRPAKGIVKLKLRLGPVDSTKRPVRQMTDVAASRDIRVVPNAMGPSVTATWAADGSPNDATEGGLNPSGDVCIFSLTPHMHKRGMIFTIDYEEDGKPPKRLVTSTDYLHPTTSLLPTLGTNAPGLLRAYTAENGHPRIRYTCTHGNGVEGKELKMGCELTAGVAPGRSASEAHPDNTQLLGSDDHARPCGLDAVNCAGYGTGKCVPANLVFGPLSDDDMCILVPNVYQPRPGVPPELACLPNY